MAKIWLSIPQYTEKTGLSKYKIMQKIERGELTARKETENGHWYIHTEVDTTAQEVLKKLDMLEKQIELLCKHLGMKGL